MSKERTNDSRQKTLGLSVKRIREQKKLSQEKLAEAADIHTSYIGQIERGFERIDEKFRALGARVERLD